MAFIFFGHSWSHLQPRRFLVIFGQITKNAPKTENFLSALLFLVCFHSGLVSGDFPIVCRMTHSGLLKKAKK